MVHKYEGRGIKKYKPIKLIAYDFTDGEWQSMDLYPETKIIVIHPADIGEAEEVREFDKIKDGVK
jgi:hypothetical protein